VIKSVPVTILVADENDLRRRTIRRALEGAGFVVVAEADDGLEAVEQALETRPVLCLIDVDLPKQSGIAAAAVLARVLDSTSIVLVAPEPTVGDVLDAVRAGAAGCLPRDLDTDRLPSVLDAVAAGEAAFPRRALREALSFLVPQVA